jgi:hypothetical protein
MEEINKRISISILALWRDAASYIDDALRMLEGLEEAYSDIDFEYYFYENDSKDGTAEKLHGFIYSGRKGHLQKETLNRPRYPSTRNPERMMIMADYRNRLLNSARPITTDYALLWDSDVIFEIDSIKKHLYYAQELKGFSLLCPNIRQPIPCQMGGSTRDSYYDVLALRDLNGVQSMYWSDNPFFDEDDRNKYDKGEPVKVLSGFGGFAFAKGDLMNKAWWDSDGGLEHWHLCEKLSSFGVIYFLPDLRTRIRGLPDAYSEEGMAEVLDYQHQMLNLTSWERGMVENRLTGGEWRLK